MKRHPDGRWRNTRQAMVVTNEVRRAKWMTAEVMAWKEKGLSFERIAEMVGRAGRGESWPLVAIPDGVTFPPDYSISRQRCHQAFQRELSKQPSLAVEEFRKLDNNRSETLYLSLQGRISKGEVHAVEVGLKVLDHSAKINGYAAPQRHELSGKDGKPLTLVQLLAAVGPIPDDEED